jgi:hypothetical protein
MPGALGFNARVRSPCPLHAAPVVRVLRRDLGPLGARSQRQHNEQRGEPSAPVHRFLWTTHPPCLPVPAIGSIRLGSLFLALPTRGLTGQHVFSSAE